jgi:tRNA(Leu) C34 or U34 (ribose-2'-O)-methylase TrmL
MSEANRASPGRAPAVALVDPKFPHNVGAALRACSCWGIPQLWWTGARVSVQLGKRLPREERMKGFRAVEMIHDEEFLARFERGAFTPVAVELRPQAESLPEFVHPEDALYIFGPEDASIPKAVLARCHRFVVIPTHHCLNLGAAVNVVLYDRRLKRHLAGIERVPHITEMLREHRGYIEIEEMIRYADLAAVEERR